MSKKGAAPAAEKADTNTNTGLVALVGSGVGDQLPAYMKQDSSRGSENVGTNDLVIPRLEIVQSLSPQRKKQDPAYIDGAEEGNFFNNVTGELFKSHVLVVPVFFRPEFLVWKDRKKGGGQGGFRGAFQSMDDAKAAIEQLQADDPEVNSNLVINDTHQHFCLMINPDTGNVSEIVLSLAKSKLKISKKWNSLVRMLGGDRFSRAYKLTTCVDKNAKGEEFYNLAPIVAAGFPSKELYERAEKLYDQIAKGGVAVDRGEVHDGEDAGAPRDF